MEEVEEDLEVSQFRIFGWFLLEELLGGGWEALEALGDGAYEHFGICCPRVLGVGCIGVGGVGMNGASEVDDVSRVELLGEQVCESRIIKSIAFETIAGEVRELKVVGFMGREVAVIVLNDVGGRDGTARVVASLLLDRRKESEEALVGCTHHG